MTAVCGGLIAWPYDGHNASPCDVPDTRGYAFYRLHAAVQGEECLDV